MDRLTLREHIRMLLVAGLCRCEPLQRRAVFGGLNADAELEVWRCRFDLLFAEMNGERATIRLDTLWRQIPLDLFSLDTNAIDLQVAVVLLGMSFQ
jgi:hypothetical protein